MRALFCTSISPRSSVGQSARPLISWPRVRSPSWITLPDVESARIARFRRVWPTCRLAVILYNLCSYDIVVHAQNIFPDKGHTRPRWLIYGRCNVGAFLLRHSCCRYNMVYSVPRYQGCLKRSCPASWRWRCESFNIILHKKSYRRSPAGHCLHSGNSTCLATQPVTQPSRGPRMLSKTVRRQQLTSAVAA